MANLLKDSCAVAAEDDVRLAQTPTGEAGDCVPVLILNKGGKGVVKMLDKISVSPFKFGQLLLLTDFCT